MQSWDKNNSFQRFRFRKAWVEVGGGGRGVQAGEADRQRTLDHVVIAILQSHKAVLVRISYLQDREGSLIKLLLMPQRDSLVYGFQNHWLHPQRFFP